MAGWADRSGEWNTGSDLETAPVRPAADRPTALSSGTPINGLRFRPRRRRFMLGYKSVPTGDERAIPPSVRLHAQRFGHGLGSGIGGRWKPEHQCCRSAPPARVAAWSTALPSLLQVKNSLAPARDIGGSLLGPNSTSPFAFFFRALRTFSGSGSHPPRAPTASYTASATVLALRDAWFLPHFGSCRDRWDPDPRMT